jgi:hypothetical protein
MLCRELRASTAFDYVFFYYDVDCPFTAILLIAITNIISFHDNFECHLTIVITWQIDALNGQWVR